MYGFEGLGLSEVQLSISELSVVGGRDKRTSWSDLVGVRQKRFSGHGGYDGVDGSDDDG